MNIKQFLEKANSAKSSYISSSGYLLEATSNKDMTLQSIRAKEVPRRRTFRDGCRVDNRTVVVEFLKPTKMTIFQAGMLYALYAHGKIVRDYGDYDKYPAGIKFIESIKSIEVI